MASIEVIVRKARIFLGIISLESKRLIGGYEKQREEIEAYMQGERCKSCLLWSVPFFGQPARRHYYIARPRVAKVGPVYQR